MSDKNVHVYIDELLDDHEIHDGATTMWEVSYAICDMPKERSIKILKAMLEWVEGDKWYGDREEQS